MEKNKNITYIMIALLVIVLLFAIWYFVGNKSTTNTSDNSGPIGNNITQDDINAPATETNESQTAEEIVEEEEERLAEIQSEREKLLAEQAELEAQRELANSPNQDGTSKTETNAERAAREQRESQIDLGLLELQNQEEYPPLPNPGL